MPQVAGEVRFITLILGIVLFTLIALSAGGVFLHRYEHRSSSATQTPILS